MLEPVRPQCRTKGIQEAIDREFPSYPYDGVVMAQNNPSAVYEVFTDDLNTYLSGKTWRDLYPEFVNVNEDEYVLMNGTALLAFLGAWLWRAAEDLDSENQVRHALVFHLASHAGSEAQGSGLWGQSFGSLNQRQRDVIRTLVECAVTNAPESEKDLLHRALRNIEANPWMG